MDLPASHTTHMLPASGDMDMCSISDTQPGTHTTPTAAAAAGAPLCVPVLVAGADAGTAATVPGRVAGPADGVSRKSYLRHHADADPDGRIRRALGHLAARQWDDARRLVDQYCAAPTQPVGAAHGQTDSLAASLRLLCRCHQLHAETKAAADAAGGVGHAPPAAAVAHADAGGQLAADALFLSGAGSHHGLAYLARAAYAAVCRPAGQMFQLVFNHCYGQLTAELPSDERQVLWAQTTDDPTAIAPLRAWLDVLQNDLRTINTQLTNAAPAAAAAAPVPSQGLPPLLAELPPDDPIFELKERYMLSIGDAHTLNELRREVAAESDWSPEREPPVAPEVLLRNVETHAKTMLAMRERYRALQARQADWEARRGQPAEGDNGELELVSQSKSESGCSRSDQEDEEDESEEEEAADAASSQMEEDEAEEEVVGRKGGGKAAAASSKGTGGKKGDKAAGDKVPDPYISKPWIPAKRIVNHIFATELLVTLDRLSQRTGRPEIRSASVFYLDAADLRTTRLLLNWFHPQQLYVPNPVAFNACRAGLELLGQPSLARKFHPRVRDSLSQVNFRNCATTDFIESPGPRFSGVWLDYTGTLKGNQKLKETHGVSNLVDLQWLFEHGRMADESVLAITVCTRTSAEIHKQADLSTAQILANRGEASQKAQRQQVYRSEQSGVDFEVSDLAQAHGYRVTPVCSEHRQAGRYKNIRADGNPGTNMLFCCYNVRFVGPPEQLEQQRAMWQFVQRTVDSEQHLRRVIQQWAPVTGQVQPHEGAPPAAPAAAPTPAAAAAAPTEGRSSKRPRS